MQHTPLHIRRLSWSKEEREWRRKIAAIMVKRCRAGEGKMFQGGGGGGGLSVFFCGELVQWFVFGNEIRTRIDAAKVDGTVAVDTPVHW